MDAAAPSSVIALRKRFDLVIRLQDDGRWVVKDPLTLNYSMLSDAEMFVLRSLDGRMNPVSVLAQLRETWPASDFSMQDLRDLVRQFVASQLVLGAPASMGATRVSRGVVRWFGKLASVFRLRIPLVNPDRWLEKLRPWLKALFQPSVLAVSLLLMAVAFGIVCIRFDDFVRSLPGLNEVTTGENLLTLLIAFVVIKALHEFGHAATAKHFGAECHEAGIWLLLLTPILYTNVTDSWLLPRRQRIMVTVAGIFTELIIASMAAILWSLSNPGSVQSMLANIVVLCTVNTVLFNGNPLLRYDGYFLLADAMALPNLAQRSAISVRHATENLLLGPPVAELNETNSDATTSGGLRWFLLGYGLLSTAYRFILTLTILVLFMRLFDRWNLRVLGIGLMSFGAASMLLIPSIHNVAAFVGAVFARKNPRRSMIRAGCILAAVIAILFVPFPRSIVVPAVIEPHGSPVFAALTGLLQQATAYDSTVRRGDVIATLAEPRLQRELLQLRSDVTVREQQLRALELSRDSSMQALIPEVKSSLEGTRNRLAQFEAEVSRLTIRATEDGILRAPRPVPRNLMNPDDLSFWTGLALEPRNIGATIVEGTLLGYLDSPVAAQSSEDAPSSEATSDDTDHHSERFELLLSLTDRDRQRVLPNQSAAFCLTGHPGLSWSGVVRQVASLQVSEIPRELIASGLDSDSGSTQGDDKKRRWQAIVDVIVPDEQDLPVLYSTGHVRIHIAPASIASRFSEFISDTFR